MLRSGEPALSDRRNGGSRTGTCFLPPRRTAGFSTPQDCPLRGQSCYGRNDNEGGVSQYYANLNSNAFGLQQKPSGLCGISLLPRGLSLPARPRWTSCQVASSLSSSGPIYPKFIVL